MHIHVETDSGEAKFWIEPVVALADYQGLNKKEINEIQKIVEGRTSEITKAWKKHFSES